MKVVNRKERKIMSGRVNEIRIEKGVKNEEQSEENVRPNNYY